MDPITLVVGAGLLVAGVLVGEVHGRIAAAHRRPKSPPEVKPICGCDHHLADHDRETGTCHNQWLEDREEYRDGQTRQWEERVRCACRRYVGPVPIETLWTPPVLPEVTDR